MLAVGGEPGKPYEVSAWEWSFRARPHVDAGEWEQAIAIIGEGLRGTRRRPLLYNLACCEARLGRLDEAVEHLREALADEPRRARVGRGGPRPRPAARSAGLPALNPPRGMCSAMADYTKLNLKQDVEDMASRFDLSPGLESHFARKPLELKQSGVS